MSPSADHAQRRLGKAPKKFDHRTLQLARYLPKLPPPPPSVDHASRLPADLGMMTNDRLGSCTIAAAGHMIQSWSTYAERGPGTVSDAQIEAAYRAISPRDQGAALLDALNYWRKTGVGPDRIEAYAEAPAGDITYAKLCIQYFGSAYIGMSLPDENTFGPWTTPTGPPNRYNGHAVNLCAYDDERQMFKVATWGEVWDLSFEWLRRYNDESYAVLNDMSLIQASGLSPDGFDWATLESDIGHIGDPVDPPVDPPPPPPPPDPVTPPSPCEPEMIALLRDPQIRGAVMILGANRGVRRFLARAIAASKQTE